MSFQDFRDAVGKNNSINDYKSFAHDGGLHNFTGDGTFGRSNTDNLSMFHSFDEGRPHTPGAGFSIDNGVSSADNANAYKMVECY